MKIAEEEMNDDILTYLYNHIDIKYKLNFLKVCF